MIAEVIEKVRAAEQAADTAVREANAKVREIEEETAVKTEQILEEAKRRVREQYRRELAGADREAEATADAILQAGALRSEELRQNASKSADQAVNFIVKQIVSI